MDGRRGKGRQAHCYVLGPIRIGCTVSYPFRGVGEDRLAGADVHHPAGVFHPQGAAQHHRELVELRRLSVLQPSPWAPHVSDTQPLVRGVHASNIFVDQFGFVPRGFHTRGRGNQGGHGVMVAVRRQTIKQAFQTSWNRLPEVPISDLPQVGAVGILAFSLLCL